MTDRSDPDVYGANFVSEAPTTANDLVERLRARSKIAREEASGTADADARHFDEAADEIERLCAVEQLHFEETRRANAFEEECNRLRAALTSAQSELEIQRASQCSAVDQMLAAEVKLTSARKALEEIIVEDTTITDGGKCHDLGMCAEIAHAALFSLSSSYGKSNE